MNKPALYVTGFILIFVVAFAAFYMYFSSTQTGGGPSGKQFVGSINSNVYHYPSCQYAQRIKPENQIWFTDSEDARAHGYRPCKVCNPP